MILMRLKDADTLIETICHDCTYRCNEYCREIKHIINAPTVDAVPVVHGKWLHDNYGANFCSECMKHVFEDNEYRLILHTRYCPHCGAKMDEKGGYSDAYACWSD